MKISRLRVRTLLRSRTTAGAILQMTFTRAIQVASSGFSANYAIIQIHVSNEYKRMKKLEKEN